MAQTLDVYTSVIILPIIGWVGYMVSKLTKLPRVTPMILLGIAIYPHIHPSVLNKALVTGYASTVPVEKLEDGHGTVNPAATFQIVGLLIALARGGLSVRVGQIRKLLVPMVFVAIVPFWCELIAMALVAPHILPETAGLSNEAGKLSMFTVASSWASLGPSIIIPNMMSFLESGITNTAQIVLLAAPLEVSTTMVSEGILYSAYTQPDEKELVLQHLPTYVIGSVLYGFAFALALKGFWWLRTHARVVERIGKAEPTDALVSFILVYFLCYTTSVDDKQTDWLIGLFAAISCGVGTQFLMPEAADAMLIQLKTIWTFVEFCIFPLTGCTIRPAIDKGDATALFGSFLAVLVVGQLGRCVGDFITALAWHWYTEKKGPRHWKLDDCSAIWRRTVFLWVTTIPKGQPQATLAPVVGAAMAARGLTAAGAFVPVAGAISILYSASIGSLLTYTAGFKVGKWLEKRHRRLAAAEAAKPGADGDVTAAAIKADAAIVARQLVTTAAEMTPDQRAVAAIDARGACRRRRRCGGDGAGGDRDGDAARGGARRRRRCSGCCCQCGT
jgi:hypothetical protein